MLISLYFWSLIKFTKNIGIVFANFDCRHLYFESDENIIIKFTSDGETLFSYSMNVKEIVPTPKEFLAAYDVSIKAWYPSAMTLINNGTCIIINFNWEN